MLGILRFVLAYLVFLSHFPENGLKLNLGVVSVIVFYFISGFLMMRSYQRFQQHSTTPVRSFYIDRCIKIFPQYLIVLFLTVLCFTIFGVSTEGTLSYLRFDKTQLIIDSLLLPIHYVTGSIGDLFLSDDYVAIVFPAWSLAIEFHFYLLVPILVLMSFKSITAVVLVSAALLSFSFFTKNPHWDALNFGYRVIIPMLVVFIYGMMYSSSKSLHKKLSFIIWAYFCALLIGVLPAFQSWYHVFVQEIVLGIVVALPVFHFAYNFKSDLNWFRSADRFLGDLSYPVFLSHYLAIYLAQHLFGVSSFAKVYFFIASVATFIFISVILALLQRYIDSKRIHYRGFKSLRTE